VFYGWQVRQTLILLSLQHWVMLFIWQFPSMTAAYAWCCYLSGLTLYLCNPFIRRLEYGDQHKVSVVYLSVAIICLLTYVFSTLFVYTGERELLHSVASTRSGTLESTRTNTLEMETLIAAARPDPRRSKTDQLIIEHRERGLYGRVKRQLLYS
jgi:predicted PurR-regulated permease PerM